MVLAVGDPERVELVAKGLCCGLHQPKLRKNFKYLRGILEESTIPKPTENTGFQLRDFNPMPRFELGNERKGETGCIRPSGPSDLQPIPSQPRLD